jgi:hypothetical protein
VYIKAWKQSTADKLQKQAESPLLPPLRLQFLLSNFKRPPKRLQKKLLYQDSQEEQEDNDISNSSDKESLDKEPKFISNI